MSKRLHMPQIGRALNRYEVQVINNSFVNRFGARLKLILEESTIRLTRFFWFGFRYDRYFLELGDECNIRLKRIRINPTQLETHLLLH
ncbi:hypothetical protein LXL04_026381 [Taraxacum kok-saghyz]